MCFVLGFVCFVWGFIFGVLLVCCLSFGGVFIFLFFVGFLFVFYFLVLGFIIIIIFSYTISFAHMGKACNLRK